MSSLIIAAAGAGKTTFTQGVGLGLNIKQTINSPTFNILKCYFDGTLPLYHIDAYRLEDNVNADIAAAHIAAKIGAKKLILMTDIRGLLKDVNDEDSLISVVNVSEVPMLKREGIIKGGMIPKIDCCVEAVRSGVSRAHIIDGRIEHSILIEMFSDEGIGTMFY